MADFRSIYHIGWREAKQLPAEEFFALALRLPFYSGVIAARAQQEDKDNRRNVTNPNARMVDLHDPAMSDLIEIA